ncbi:MAG: hypothetical protein CVU05_08045 [Bacteroidetes bacterium HGW-Bacteroidetes-21]|nr:MAG: hypothetical protein CVU05_08045 [Bacteroidetes bacterium HGW-Bacteroidetes-21]
MLKNYQRFFSDIRFWIVLALVLRLYQITSPPLETLHNWRQVTGNMVARNFLEIDNNILYPRLDFAGEKSGITGTEFPLLNYLIYIVSYIFDWNHWYGRLINLIVSSLGIWFFYKIVHRFIRKEYAFSAAIILLCSIWFIYSRKSMPDTFSASLGLMGIWYGLVFLQESKVYQWLLFLVFTTLAVLSKIPAIILFSGLLVPLFSKTFSLRNRLLLSLGGLIALLPSVWWYYVHVPYLNLKGDFVHYYMGTTLTQGWSEILTNINGTLETFYFTPLMFSGFALFLTGIVLCIVKKNRLIIAIFSIALFFWTFFILKSGRNYFIHGYYIVPFVPFMALMAASGLNYIKNKKIATALLLIFVIESLANQQHDFHIRNGEERRLQLESIADSVIEKNALIIINGGDNPRDIYYIHRKGWSVKDENLNKNTTDSLFQKGAKYLVLDKNYYQHTFTKDLLSVFDNQNYSIFKLP